jgi:hypothetical protein
MANGLINRWSIPVINFASPLNEICAQARSKKLRNSEFLRSEAEQLVGHELIKDLGKFKQMVVALLSPR